MPHPAAQWAPHPDPVQPTSRGWCRTWTPSSAPFVTSMPSSARSVATGPRRRRIAGPGVRRPARPERPAVTLVATEADDLQGAGSIRLRRRDARRPGRAAPAAGMVGLSGIPPICRGARGSCSRQRATSSEAAAHVQAAWPRAATASAGSAAFRTGWPRTTSAAVFGADRVVGAVTILGGERRLDGEIACVAGHLPGRDSDPGPPSQRPGRAPSRGFRPPRSRRHPGHPDRSGRRPQRRRRLRRHLVLRISTPALPDPT